MWNVAIYTDDTTLYCKWDQVSYLWQQLELASELGFDRILKRLWTRAESGLLSSVLEKLNWFRLTGIITLVLLMWKWMSLFLWGNHLLRNWSCLSFPNWIGELTLSLLLKLSSRKLGSWFVLWSFFLLSLHCISFNLPYDLVWNTVLLATTPSWFFYYHS